MAAGIVAALVAAGIVIAAVAAADSLWRELGLALLSGGVVGGALTAVEYVLAGAADARSDHNALLAQLSSTIDLNGIDLSGRDLRRLYLPGRAAVAARCTGTLLDDS